MDKYSCYQFAIGNFIDKIFYQDQLAGGKVQNLLYTYIQ